MSNKRIPRVRNTIVCLPAMLLAVVVAWLPGMTVRGQEVDKELVAAVRGFQDAIRRDNGDAEQMLKEVREAMSKQLDGFIKELASQTDDQESLTGQVASLQAAKAGLIDTRVEMLSYQIENEVVPDMLRESFRETCRELNVRIDLNHCFRLNSLEPGQRYVKLKLPGLDCPGCAQVIQTTLTGIEGIESFDKSISDRVCAFVAPEELDLEATLTELGKTVKQFESWEILE